MTTQMDCSVGGSTALIEGYASVFGERDLNGDVVRRGAFAGKLVPAASSRGKIATVKMLYQHEASRPIGRWLVLKETGKGLYVRGEIILDAPGAREVASLVAGGAIDGLSIGFRTLKARKRPGGRELLAVDLWEVSVVTFPMAPGARITRIDYPGSGMAGKMSTAGLLRQAASRVTS